jgi:integrase
MRNQGLTSVAVSKAKPKTKEGRTVRTESPDRLCRGLYLVIQPSGAKSWAVRYRHGGKPRKLTLGAAIELKPGEPTIAEPKIGDALTLAAARRLAAEAMHQVDLGRDPAGEKARRPGRALAVAASFEAVADNYLRREGRGLRTVEWRRTVLKRLVHPSLGVVPINEIRRSDVVSLLDTIEDENGAVMADRVLAVVRKVMNWHASRSDDFRSPIVRGMARTKPKERARERILTDEELRAVWSAAEAGGRFGALVRFILLTAARRLEAAAMPWTELMGEDWILPPKRNKTKVELVRPLSGSAKALLEEIPRGARFVFGIGDRPLGGFSKPKRAFDKLCGVSGWTLHDLRRTARSLMSRAGVPADHAERCLGHVIGGVRGVYDRHEYHAEKQRAYEALATQLDLILHLRPNVAQLRPNAGGVA